MKVSTTVVIESEVQELDEEKLDELRERYDVESVPEIIEAHKERVERLVDDKIGEEGDTIKVRVNKHDGRAGEVGFY